MVSRLGVWKYDVFQGGVWKYVPGGGGINACPGGGGGGGGGDGDVYHNLVQGRSNQIEACPVGI